MLCKYSVPPRALAHRHIADRHPPDPCVREPYTATTALLPCSYRRIVCTLLVVYVPLSTRLTWTCTLYHRLPYNLASLPGTSAASPTIRDTRQPPLRFGLWQSSSPVSFRRDVRLYTMLSFTPGSRIREGHAGILPSAASLRTVQPRYIPLYIPRFLLSSYPYFVSKSVLSSTFYRRASHLLFLLYSCVHRFTRLKCRQSVSLLLSFRTFLVFVRPRPLLYIVRPPFLVVLPFAMLGYYIMETSLRIICCITYPRVSQ